MRQVPKYIAESWRDFASRHPWCSRVLIWTVGFTAVWGILSLTGPRIVLWEFTQLALSEESPFQITERLLAPQDIGGPTVRNLMALLKHKRPEVRAAASGLLIYTQQRDPIQGLSAYYDDADPAVSVACLIAGADRGDRGALLRLYERFIATNPDSDEYRIGRTLARSGFREAGDEAVQRIPSAGGKPLWRSLNRLEGMLRNRGFVGSRGILAGGAFLTTERSEPLTPDEEQALASALTDMWRIARTEYRSISDFREGDHLFPPAPPQSFEGCPGRRILLIHLLVAELLWTVGFWGFVIVQRKRVGEVAPTKDPDSNTKE